MSQRCNFPAGASAQTGAGSKPSEQSSSAKLAPRGPPPPKLDAGFEDKAPDIGNIAIIIHTRPA
eukprot:29960-Amphidinium_carterae.1